MSPPSNLNALSQNTSFNCPKLLLVVLRASPCSSATYAIKRSNTSVGSTGCACVYKVCAASRKRASEYGEGEELNDEDGADDKEADVKQKTEDECIDHLAKIKKQENQETTHNKQQKHGLTCARMFAFAFVFVVFKGLENGVVGAKKEEEEEVDASAEVGWLP